MMVLGFDVGDNGSRSMALRLDVAHRLWPSWHYDGSKARVSLIGYDLHRVVPASRFTVRELAAIRQAEEVLRYPSPLLFAGLLEQLADLTPIRWRCGRQVDVERVVARIRAEAIVS